MKKRIYGKCGGSRMKEKLIKLAVITFVFALSFINMGGMEAKAANQDFTIKNGVLVSYNGGGKYVKIPKGVKEIGEKAFFCNKKIEKVAIPKGVTKIGDNAFEGCTKLHTVTMPKGLKKIGGNAFWQCVKLKNATIPKGVGEIGNGAFAFCAIKKITLPEGVEKIGEIGRAHV